MTSAAVAKGWHSRALTTPHPNPSTWTPKRADLVFAATYNAMSGSGFTMALFSDRTAVDAQGRVLRVAQPDFDILTRLASSAAKDVPKTKEYHNTWRIAHNSTCWTNDYLLVAQEKSGKLAGTGVYGFDGKTRLLSKPVGWYIMLPAVLQEIFGLMLEAREGATRGPTPGAVRKVTEACDLCNVAWD